jgi:hypothetical protein
VLLALTLLLAQSTAPAQAVLRSLEVAVLDESGASVAGLVPAEVVVLENGVARDVSQVEPDTRPLSVTLLVDSSQSLRASYRLQLVPAVEEFLAELPPETRIALWTTGARPSLRYGPGSDAAAAARSLLRVVPEGGNTMLDALVETTRELGTPEGERTAVVVLSSRGLEFSSRDRRQVVDAARSQAGEFHVVHFQEGDADQEMQVNYSHVFSQLTKQSGGRHETPLSSMATAARLRQIGADLAGRYRIRYATLEGLEKRELEVQVARPGVKARVVAARDAR